VAALTEKDDINKPIAIANTAIILHSFVIKISPDESVYSRGLLYLYNKASGLHRLLGREIRKGWP
jgi:hypothetical protein